MRSLPAFLALMFVLAASAASADSRVFIVANQADGYGVDQCLAMGEKCGAHAAQSYCQSRDFAQALSYRRIDPDEVAGSILPASARSAPRRPSRKPPLPHRRPGNDVTVPREAAMSGPALAAPFGSNLRGVALMAGYA